MATPVVTPTATPPAFPTDVSVSEVEVTTSTSSISVEEAKHRRFLQKWTSVFLLGVLGGLSLTSIYLVYDTAVHGTPEGQKLAFGLIGTVLGILWTNYAKLVEAISKR